MSQVGSPHCRQRTALDSGGGLTWPVRYTRGTPHRQHIIAIAGSAGKYRGMTGL